jgi:hypothetical protein
LGIVNEIQSLKRKIASSIRENLSNHEIEEGFPEVIICG